VADHGTIAGRDDRFLYLHKPAGIHVFPPHADPDGDCLLRRLIEDAPEQRDVTPDPAFAGGILHRLDRHTSGLVIAARTPEALTEGRARFATHTLEKVYRFRTAARPAWTENRCAALLAHDRRRKSKMVWQRGRSTPHRGKWYPAETSFRRLGDGLWEARMKTGVTHQIRVHAAAVGLALLGDRLYGAAPHPDDRYFLHHRGIPGWDGAPLLDAPWAVSP